MIRIFFSKSNGNILVVTSKTTKDQDLLLYGELQNDDMDFIELDDGTSLKDFSNFKSCKINTETKELEIIHYTEDQTNIIQKQNKELQDFISRVSDISAYLSNSDETTIANVEDLVLETEQNKIINGGI